MINKIIMAYVTLCVTTVTVVIISLIAKFIISLLGIPATLGVFIIILFILIYGGITCQNQL